MNGNKARSTDWMSASHVALACGGRVLRAGALARGVSVDTRQLVAGQCFVALPGSVQDGHDFVAEALALGAAGAVVARPPVMDPPAGAFLVQVSDTRVALLRLAAEHRRRLPIKVVGITGSCGKTTTKDMLAGVLSAAMPTVSSPRSFNNHVGVPLTLFQAGAGTRAAVVEVGTSAPGEIAALAKVVQPDCAIVTCVAQAHLAGLGSLQGVAREKASLVEALAPEGLAILNGDDASCRRMIELTRASTVLVRLEQEADWFATGVRFHGLGTSFLLQGKRPVTLPRLGSHNVYNALFTIAAATHLGMDLDTILEALCGLPPSDRRLEQKVAGAVTVFDDTYNMNPASARAGLQALAGLQGARRKLVVFGEMLELGEQAVALHRGLGADVARSGIDVLLCVGSGGKAIAAGARAAGMPRSRIHLAADPSVALEVLLGIVRPGDQVLCKASRRIGLDRLVDDLMKALGPRSALPCHMEVAH